MPKSEQDESSTRKHSKPARLRHIPIAKKLWWWSHVRFPQIVPAPNSRFDYRNPDRDRRENEKTKVPPDEAVSVLAIWATEAYGPAEIDALYTGLEALNWDQDCLHSEGAGCVDWIKRQRQLGTSGTFNVGIVQRHGESRYIPRDYFAVLPPGIEYLIVEIHQICPSLTCVQIAFILGSTHQRVYEDQLQLDRTTTHEPIKDRFGAYRILGPRHQKQRAIESQRRVLQTLATEWFQKHFPGIFCSTPSDRPPTAELIATRRESLFEYPKGQQPSFHSWPRLLTNWSRHDAWKSTEHQSLLFATHETANEDLSHIVITLSTEGISEDAVKLYGGREQHAFIAFVQDQLDGILARFAVIALLNSFRRTLMQTRDQLRTASPRKRRVLRSLDYIQDFFSMSLQVPSIVGELAHTTKAKHSYRWSCDGFVEATPFRDEEPPAKLYERLSARTNALANRMLQDDRTTRESFKQISEVVTARESVKAQRRMELLAIAAIGIAALSLWITLPPMKEWRVILLGFTKQTIGAPEQPHQVPPRSSLLFTMARPLARLPLLGGTMTTTRKLSATPITVLQLNPHIQRKTYSKSWRTCIN